MNIIAKRKLYFIFSGLVIIPGFISLVLFGLLLSIDFTGGSKAQYQIAKVKSDQQTVENQIRSVISQQKATVVSLQASGSTYNVRMDPIDQPTHQKIFTELKKKYSTVKELSFETVGATIGSETEKSAITAVLIASIAITLYIAFAFREVSKPVSSWKFGVCAIIALLHDVLVTVGIFSIMGHFFGVEVDSLFITALLTIMGFSVHDTIVVFDRIRENLKKNISLSFEEVINNSILETFNRSLNTSLTVVVVLFTLLLFSSESITWFVVALLIGILSGTYSSIFNASPMLVVWYNWDKRRKNQK